MSTHKADATIRAGRLAKANQFASAAHDVLDLAEEAQDVADAFATLAVHAGIAASDVICSARLGAYHQGDRHEEAIALLSQADAEAAKSLSVLLRMKTLAGYGYTPVSAANRVKAERAMDALVAAANAVWSRGADDRQLTASTGLAPASTRPRTRAQLPAATGMARRDDVRSPTANATDATAMRTIGGAGSSTTAVASSAKDSASERTSCARSVVRPRRVVSSACVRRLVALDLQELAAAGIADRRMTADMLADLGADLVWQWTTVDAHRHLARYELLLHARRRPELAVELHAAGDRLRSAMADVLAMQGSSDPAATAVWFVGCIDGVVLDQLTGPPGRRMSRADLRAFATVLAEAALGRGPGDAEPTPAV